ncbi:MAG: hypothetical protein JW908_14490 [Anaerolineales bacterium]|nr:hypothetical protein [Anaerolineales bacterium]
MTDVQPEQEPNPPGYCSFVLRCWTGDDGRVHARLIDIRTNVGHAVGKLSCLPDLVRRLVMNAAEIEALANDSPRIDQT